jgi:hypothetical protein
MKNKRGYKWIAVLTATLVAMAGHLPAASATEPADAPPEQLVVEGTGDFPRVAVAAPGPDGVTLALYLVEGNKATQLATLNGSTVGTNSVQAELSPDGLHVACLRTVGGSLRPVLEVIHTETLARVTVAEGPTQAREKGAPWDELTSVAWMDSDNLLYVRVSWSVSVGAGSASQEEMSMRADGELWVSDLDGRRQELLVAGSVYRVLGASSDTSTVYATRLIPGTEEWRDEGFAVVQRATGKMENLWPVEDGAQQRYHNFGLVNLPDGSLRVLYATSGQEQTVSTSAPVIWMGDPHTGHTDEIWVIRDGMEVSKTGVSFTAYDIPGDFLWSPTSGFEFVYLADGAALGGAWRVDLSANESHRLERAGSRLVEWTDRGIVAEGLRAIHLLDKVGVLGGEILLSPDLGGETRQSPPGTVVDWDVPYIHQLWDTPTGFDGHWACGPTSAVMALAYYQQLRTHPDGYGWYVSNQYTNQSACSGGHTFSRLRHDPAQNLFAGAYGSCTEEVWVNNRWEAYATAENITEYGWHHDVGHSQDAATPDIVMAELDGGGVVILGTKLTDGGHIVLVRGYTADGRFIVNDPYGEWLYRDAQGNHYDIYQTSQPVVYSWADMQVKWYRSLYGPHYLPDLSKPGYSYDGSMVTTHNGSAWSADVDLCLVNTGGSLNRIVHNTSIPAHGSWSATLVDEFGWSASFDGSGVVVPNQTGVSAIALQELGSSRSAARAVSAPDTSSTVHLPTVQRDPPWWYSTIQVHNTSSQGTTVRATYYAQNGSTLGSVYRYVNSNGKAVFDQSDGNHAFLGNDYYGSCVVSSLTQGIPLAVDVYVPAYSTPALYSSTGFSAGFTELILPALFDGGYGSQNASFAIKNLGTSSAYVRIAFRPRVGEGHTYSCNDYRWISTSFAAWLPAYPGPCNFPTGWTGSATATSLNYQPLAGVVHQDQTGSYQAGGYSALVEGSTEVVLPYMPRGYQGWDGSFAVQNMGSSAASVTVTYYRQNGTTAYTGGPYSIPAGTSQAWYLPNIPQLSNDLYSAVARSNGQPICAMANVHDHGLSGGDDMVSYNGIHR